MAAAENTTRSVDYAPRAQFVDFHNRSKRWAAIVAHRRAGKTVACIMELLTRALATTKKDARYAYIAPFREQAKTVAWSYLKRYAESVVREPEKDVRESDLSVKLFNGSIIRLFGADNPNALRGMYLDGVVLDEYADMRPSLWGEVIRPTLSDRKGWAVFIGTPKGRNEFYTLLYGDDDRSGASGDPEWFMLTLKASETGILPDTELQSARKSMSEEQYAQEYECSFDAPNIGAYYRKEIIQAEKENRIGRVPVAPGVPCETWWDLGMDDSMSIWISQTVVREIRFVHYHEDSGEGLPHYATYLHEWAKAHDVSFSRHGMPHDIEVRELGTGKSRRDVCERELNLKPLSVSPRLDPDTGIENARRLLSQCWFDAVECKRGLAALREYSKEWDERNKVFAARPLHNWASHGADAFRTMANLHPGRGTVARASSDRYSGQKRRQSTWMSS